MSDLATEINGSGDTITNLEFFGQSFSDRRGALQKIDAFREQSYQALADSVAVLVGREVTMKFRPSTTTGRGSKFTFPCYSLSDVIRNPLERTVVIQDVDAKKNTVQIGAGEFLDGIYDQTWWVGLGNILDIHVPSEETANQ